MLPLALHWYGHGTPAEATAAPAEADTMVARAAFSNGHVVIPQIAVTEIGGKPTVFVAERDLRLLVATPVVLGAERGPDREILSGVSAGQMVVTNGLPTLRAMASR
jgi:multidrug efflux pump subunit AcrA (membrane-fusion protein)